MTTAYVRIQTRGCLDCPADLDGALVRHGELALPLHEDCRATATPVSDAEALVERTVALSRRGVAVIFRRAHGHNATIVELKRTTNHEHSDVICRAVRALAHIELARSGMATVLLATIDGLAEDLDA